MTVGDQWGGVGRVRGGGRYIFYRPVSREGWGRGFVF